MPPLLTLWKGPPGDLALAAGQVDLWRFRLALSSGEEERFTGLLNDLERLRASRLLDCARRLCFIASHGRLRIILSRYLDQDPAGLDFVFGPQGKPRLAGPGPPPLSFNLSHSGGWGLLAVAAGISVGVDVESIDTTIAYQNLAERFFSPEEKVELAQSSPLRRRRAFFRIWTRKEALLKGLGCGFSGPSVPLPYQDWSIKVLPVTRGMLGAIAVRDRFLVLRRIDYHG